MYFLQVGINLCCYTFMGSFRSKLCTLPLSYSHFMVSKHSVDGFERMICFHPLCGKGSTKIMRSLLGKTDLLQRAPEQFGKHCAGKQTAVGSVLARSWGKMVKEYIKKRRLVPSGTRRRNG